MKGKRVSNYLFWDSETSGLDHTDQIIQFGGIRTDAAFNERERYEILCLPRKDVIPAVGAFMTHGIPISRILDEGVSEPRFAHQISSLMTRESETCALGYNSISFDDNMVRQLFFRNMLDPYSREFRNNNSRHDVLKMTRMVSSLYPDMLSIPHDQEGKKSLRLEGLAPANGFSHENAHDAVADVEATIYMAKLIQNAHPELFKHCMSLNNKNYVHDIVSSGSAFLYSDGYNDTAMSVVGLHPHNKNSFICVDLKGLRSEDVDRIIETPSEQILEDMYTRGRNSSVKEIKINQTPMVFKISMINSPGIANRIGVDKESLRDSAAMLGNHARRGELHAHLFNTFDRPIETGHDVYGQLYKAFISDGDRRRLVGMKPHNMERWEDIAKTVHDDRIYDLAIRAVGNFDQGMLSSEGLERFHSWMVKRYSDESGAYGTTLPEFWHDAQRARARSDTTSEQIAVIDELESYVNSIAEDYAPELHAKKKEAIERYAASKNSDLENHGVGDSENNVTTLKDNKRPFSSMSP